MRRVSSCDRTHSICGIVYSAVERMLADDSFRRICPVTAIAEERTGVIDCYRVYQRCSLLACEEGALVKL
jgi:hypothetical protein